MKVSNPLTIIAIFSGLAETLATIALIQLPPAAQEIFIYFVMAFPAGIVLLFFFVLYFKNTVLYAPSDYEDQAHYLEVNTVKRDLNEQMDKLFIHLNSRGASLTREEIEQAKAQMEKSIEQAISISSREAQILELFSNGLSLTHIAEKLDLSPKTVNTYFYRMSNKGLLTRSGGSWKVNL